MSTLVVATYRLGLSIRVYSRVLAREATVVFSTTPSNAKQADAQTHLAGAAGARFLSDTPRGREAATAGGLRGGRPGREQAYTGLRASFGWCLGKEKKYGAAFARRALLLLRGLQTVRAACVRAPLRERSTVRREREKRQERQRAGKATDRVAGECGERLRSFRRRLSFRRRRFLPSS
ncbi:hypothetical protein MRX96_033149 [Rhipicephalus microplus]